MGGPKGEAADRDHGLPTLNAARHMCGLRRHAKVRDVASDDAATMAALEPVYSSPDEIGTFAGGLTEPHVPGAVVGEHVHKSVVHQLTRLRDGDRVYFESVYWLARVRGMPLVASTLEGRRTLYRLDQGQGQNRLTGLLTALADNANVPAVQWSDDLFPSAGTRGPSPCPLLDARQPRFSAKSFFDGRRPS